MAKELDLSSIKFNIAHIKLCTEIEGPFKRCCIWFQGCDLHCKGCCNNDLQQLKVNHIVSLETLLDIVKSAKDEYDIEGITLSGGEPTLQMHLPEFNKEVKKMGLGIIMFSGHYKKDLNPEMIKDIDLLIDGPFIESKYDDKRILIGSTNKNLTFITDRYKPYEDYFFGNSKEEVDVGDYIFINGD